ncbi:cell envelope integrity protein TolA [Acinetobacter pittii]|uniref:cell envelope integrity protein TolA n=1 Tax=Acinetobacter pittii TaxID=48296 RepID=UPI0009941743|nr:cell envelope integrity protein TolA [Acinetobacter pittii]MCZ1176804.1 cell envelope integrity protein TolA [Acinetobacter pittii]OOT53138.1 energy transducer TonB [Acinetobacter pittii]OTU65088.1 energy transducer TonB [Acinetobacter pittii]
MKKTILLGLVLSSLTCTNLYSQDLDSIVNKNIPNELRGTQEQDDALLIVKKYKDTYQKEILNAWDVPPNSAGTIARVKVLLTDKGEVDQIIFLNEISKEFKLSIEQAIKKSTPFTLPENTIIRKMARNLTINFKAT